MEIIRKKDGGGAFRVLSARVNGSIDLINRLGARDLFLSRDEYISRIGRFRSGKSGTNRKRRERSGKTGPILRREKAGTSVLGESPPTRGTSGREREREEYDKRRENGGGKDLINFSKVH